MARILGWYRARVGHAERIAEFSVSWKGGDHGPRLGLEAHAKRHGNPDDVEHLRIELSYDEAARLIEQWQRYMLMYPASPDAAARDADREMGIREWED